ncbi:MAG: lipopolysaccharide biosynthesis protein [Deltaproteobacteria bacterium]|nr:lipopolysaccharide biosynthesis protein [Deltaproteobacteria bacterium]
MTQETSFARKAARSGLWLAGFKFITQGFSWVVTISVARMLRPEDYGLMAMASILTGYIEMFSEMGIGAAIIQKKDITQEELSSTFWFNIGVGIVFALACFGLAYPTAWIFNEPGIIPITQLISVLFIIGSLMIVPNNILTRNASFKELGIINLTAVVASSLAMLWMASKGFGVWTLIYGTIILRSMTTLQTFLKAKWRPDLHFRFSEVRRLLRFGVHVAGSRSLFYVFQKSDKFIVGKVFNAQALGYYSFAMQLANIPTDKIVSTIQQVSFSVFAKYQSELGKCQDIYLKTSKYIGLLVIPLFAGGFFLGDDIIRALLGEKWAPIIFLFRLLCITQAFQAVTTINSIIHTSLGRPHWALYYILINVLILPISILGASRYGLNALAIPWVTLFPAICIGWTWMTLKKLQIPLSTYLKTFMKPVAGTLLMIAGIKVFQAAYATAHLTAENLKMIFMQELIIGALIYAIWTLSMEKKSLIEIWSLRKAR